VVGEGPWVKVIVFVGVGVRVCVGHGVRDGVIVPVGTGELVWVIVGMGVSVDVRVGDGVGDGGFPTTLKKPTRFQVRPTKICT
jgi:hypothetical protein